MPSVSALMVAATIVAATALAGESPPASVTKPQEIRAVVQRSLPAIEKAATTWMADRKCNSCHVVTFLVWSHNAAAAHGLNVDRQKLDEWTKWSLADSFEENYRFKLRPHALDALKAEGMAQSTLDKLKPLAGKQFQTQKEFLESVEKAVGKEEFESNRERLTRHGSLPNDGGGPDTLGQLLLGRGTMPVEKSTSESYAGIRKLLLEWQEPSGRWFAAGQLPSLQWENEKEMHDATTLWSLLAVSSGPATDEASVRSGERARDFLKDSKPGATLQTLALHTIAAHQFGDRAKADKLREELVARQNSDGGWSWLKTNATSDAFATGQALYALGRVGRGGADQTVQKAWQYLIRTQGDDGSWDVPQSAINKKPRKLNVYPFWGTAWAAIGLLETLPADK